MLYFVCLTCEANYLHGDDSAQYAFLSTVMANNHENTFHHGEHVAYVLKEFDA